jgi:hypothetical protein
MARVAARLPSQQHTTWSSFSPIVLDVRHHDQWTSGLETATLRSCHHCHSLRLAARAAFSRPSSGPRYRGWNFQHHITRDRRIGEGNCGEMRIEDLGDRDGKVASRIAHGLVLGR